MVSQVSLKAIKNPSWFFYFCLGLMALIYGAAGLMKVTATPELVAHLNELHFNSAWRLFIGITELLGVVGLLLPRTRALALLCLWPCVIGGLALHISFSHPASRIVPAVAAAVLVPIDLSLGGFLNLKTNE